MKNTIKVLGIIAFVAVIGFSMIACDDGSSNPFIGTWIESGSTLTVTATDSTWIAVEGRISYAGTYTWNGNIANFITIDGYSFGTANVTGNTMVITSYNFGTRYLNRQ